MADNSYVTEGQMNAFLAKLNSSGVGGGGSAPALGSIGNPYVNPTDIGSLAVGSYYATYTGDTVNLFYKGSSTTVYNYFTNPRAVSTGTPGPSTGMSINSGAALSWQTGSSRGWALGTTTCMRGTMNASVTEFFFDISVTNLPTAAVGSKLSCQVWRDTAGTVELSVDWRDSTGATLSENWQPFTVPANTVQTLTNTNLVMPSGATRARFLVDFVGMTASTGIGEATNFKLGADATLFDGATAAGNGYTYAWTGTANASSSTKTG